MDESKLEVYDLFEVSKMLKVSRVTLLKYVKAKKIKAFKVGNNWRFARADIQEFINKNYR